MAWIWNSEAKDTGFSKTIIFRIGAVVIAKAKFEARKPKGTGFDILLALTSEDPNTWLTTQTFPSMSQAMKFLHAQLNAPPPEVSHDETSG